MRVAVESTNKVEPFKPAERIHDFPYFVTRNWSRFYDVSRQDDRLLVMTGERQSQPCDIQVILNWTEELKRRVPTN